jgi:VWFA-related protein
VNVNLVLLHATVRDKSGAFVPDLTQQDFHVWEDNKPQTISFFRHEDAPVAGGLRVDNSKSMRHKRPDVTAAAMAFIHSSNPRDEVFVENFNERVSMGLPAGQDFSSQPAQLEQALDRAPAGGMTALYDAIETGLQHLRKADLDKKVLIVVSDGGDNASNARLEQVLQDAARSDAIIYTIGLFDENDPDRNPGVLKKLARGTGGECFLPSSLADVTSICQRIADDIRHQYTIGYHPSNTSMNDAYRTIKVTATRPHGGRLFVRTRSGYIAKPLPPASTQEADRSGK